MLSRRSFSTTMAKLWTLLSTTFFSSYGFSRSPPGVTRRDWSHWLLWNGSTWFHDMWQSWTNKWNIVVPSRACAGYLTQLNFSSTSPSIWFWRLNINIQTLTQNSRFCQGADLVAFWFFFQHHPGCKSVYNLDLQRTLTFPQLCIKDSAWSRSAEPSALSMSHSWLQRMDLRSNSPSFEKNRMALGVLEKCISVWGNLILLRSEYPTTKHCLSKHS